MTDKKSVRALRMNGIKSDGSTNTELVQLVVRDPFTNEEIREDDGEPAVYIMLRAMPPDEHEAIVKKHTRMEKNPNGGRGLFEVIDQNAVSDEIMLRVIASWHGFVGADDKPLQCNDRTKLRIDERIKVQVSRKIFGAEATEVASESFR